MITLKEKNSSAIINEIGFHINELILDGIEILKPSNDGHQTHGGCAFLLPYANRIKNGIYKFNSEIYEFQKNAEGNSIHGFGKELLWEVKKNKHIVDGMCNIIAPGYPFNLKVNIRLELDSSTFRVRFHFKNGGKTQLPLSPGAHPYFLFSEKWTIKFSEQVEIVEYKDNFFPTGNFIKIGNVDEYFTYQSNFDNCYKGGGVIEMEDNGKKVSLIRDDMTYFVLYNGKYSEGKSIAIEPMCSPPNSFNNRISLISLNPGDEYE
ncbi:MAG: aldose 1-epimerase, partial [Thermoplasmataceae archaeon]